MTKEETVSLEGSLGDVTDRAMREITSIIEGGGEVQNVTAHVDIEYVDKEPDKGLNALFEDYEEEEEGEDEGELPEKVPTDGWGEDAEDVAETIEAIESSKGYSIPDRAGRGERVIQLIQTMLTGDREWWTRNEVIRAMESRYDDADEASAGSALTNVWHRHRKHMGRRRTQRKTRNGTVLEYQLRDPAGLIRKSVDPYLDPEEAREGA